GIEPVVAGADDSEHDSVPALDELVDVVALVAQHGITYVDVPLVTAQQHDKMLVATDFLQHHGGNLQVLEPCGGDTVTPCPQPDGLDIALHVEHGKALGAHD